MQRERPACRWPRAEEGQQLHDVGKHTSKQQGDIALLAPQTAAARGVTTAAIWLVAHVPSPAAATVARGRRRPHAAVVTFTHKRGVQKGRTRNPKPGVVARGSRARAATTLRALVFGGLSLSQRGLTTALRLTGMSAVSISTAFDAGNAEIERQDGDFVALKIKPDPWTELEQKRHSQWFYFRATASAPGSVRYEISNAGEVSFADAWPGYEVCASTDRKTWTRIESTRYDSDRGALCWTYDHGASDLSTFFAYFDPYDYERHLDLVARCAAAPAATVRSLGQTLDGREIECVEVGNGPLHCWIIHRQHPGESQASWYAEGLLSRLLGLPRGGAPADAPDGLAVQLRRRFTFHIVPNMNPDGSVRGYLRTNACGANLNREWSPTESPAGRYEAPSLERSPEVYHALRAMDATGVDAFVDVHGDEALPVAFMAGAEGCPCWGPRIKALQSAFVAAYSRANPDMQSRIGYTADKPLEGNLAICSNQIAERFDCLAVTLEMPFKDNANNLGEATTFQGQRASALGASVLDALACVRRPRCMAGPLTSNPIPGSTPNSTPARPTVTPAPPGLPHPGTWRPRCVACRSRTSRAATMCTSSRSRTSRSSLPSSPSSWPSSMRNASRPEARPSASGAHEAPTEGMWEAHT